MAIAGRAGLRGWPRRFHVFHPLVQARRERLIELLAGELRTAIGVHEEQRGPLANALSVLHVDDGQRCDRPWPPLIAPLDHPEWCSADGAAVIDLWLRLGVLGHGREWIWSRAAATSSRAPGFTARDRGAPDDRSGARAGGRSRAGGAP